MRHLLRSDNARVAFLIALLIIVSFRTLTALKHWTAEKEERRNKSPEIPKHEVHRSFASPFLLSLPFTHTHTFIHQLNRTDSPWRTRHCRRTLLRLDWRPFSGNGKRTEQCLIIFLSDHSKTTRCYRRLGKSSRKLCFFFCSVWPMKTFHISLLEDL